MTRKITLANKVISLVTITNVNINLYYVEKISKYTNTTKSRLTSDATAS